MKDTYEKDALEPDQALTDRSANGWQSDRQKLYHASFEE